MLARLFAAVRSLAIRLTRFRLSTLLLVMAIGAILLSWRRDHLKLTAQIEQLRNPNPHWGDDEATGPPNTVGYGDITTAWASASADDQQEWLMLEFDPVTPASIHIYETYNPGAVYKVTRVNMLGVETVLWQGADPTPVGSGGGVSKLPIANAPTMTQIKIYLDSPAVPGWNEIDAVALVDSTGKSHWARRAKASTSYGPKGSLNYAW